MVVCLKLRIVISSGKVVEYMDVIWDKLQAESRSVRAGHAQSDTRTVERIVFVEGVGFICHAWFICNFPEQLGPIRTVSIKIIHV